MQLAWKEIKHSKKNYILITFTVILMIFMVIFLSGLTNGLGRAVSAGIENSSADYFVISEDAEDVIAASSLTKEQVSELSEKIGGSTAALNIQRAYINQQDSTEKIDIAYFVIKPNEFMNPTVTKGRQIGEGENEIVLNDTFAEKGIKIGDIIEDTSSGIQLQVVGFTQNAFYAHVSIGYISADTFNEIKQSVIPNYTPTYNVVAIKGTEPERLDVARIEISDKAAIVNNLPGYAAEQTTIQMIIWVLVLITGAILSVFFYIITIQKQKQYGVMKALGMKMSEIARVLISQILFLSVIGVASGNLLAYGLSKVLPSSMPFFFKGQDAMVVSLVFIGLSILGGILSIYRVGKVDPVVTIGGSES